MAGSQDLPIRNSSGPVRPSGRQGKAGRGNTTKPATGGAKRREVVPTNTTISRGRRREQRYSSRATREQYLCDLFAEQSRLHKSISRQARLLKVDRSLVESQETEDHRQITNEIVRVSANLAEESHPGAYTLSGLPRVVTPGQLLIDQQQSRIGIKFQPEAKAVGIVSRTPTDRTVKTPFDSVFQRRKPVIGDNPQFGKLEGPALRLYLRAVDRGYRGGPNQWVRSRYSRQALPVLVKKGLIGPLEKRDLCVFSPKSPLRYVHCAYLKGEHTVHRGFHGERITENGDISVLSRQRQTKRCKLSSWPTIAGRRVWPSTPTLFESWQMLVLGVKPQERYVADDIAKSSIDLSEVRDNPGLAKLIARANVLGIRAWVPVPEKLRWYFQYRWGFLILKRRIPLSIAAARFLLSVWLRAPNQCLLLVPVPLRKFLRDGVPAEWITLSAHQGFAWRSYLRTEPEPRGDGVPNSIRPVDPIRFLKSGWVRHRNLKRDDGGVRLTGPHLVRAVHHGLTVVVKR